MTFHTKPTAIEQTGNALVAFFGQAAQPKAYPAHMLLKEALRIKRQRGDADADTFKAIAVEVLAYGLNAIVTSSIPTIKARIAHIRAAGHSKGYLAQLEAFLADLEAFSPAPLTHGEA